MDGVGAAHQGAQSVIVEFIFRFEFALLSEHQKKMKDGTKEVKSPPFMVR